MNDEPLHRLAYLVRQYDLERKELLSRLNTISETSTSERTLYRWLSRETQCPGSVPIAIACSLWIEGIMPTGKFVDFLKGKKSW